MKIVIIGAGNLATQLGLNLKKRGCDIIQLYSRTESSAQALSELLQAPYTTDITTISPEADIYIYALKDDILPELIKQMPVGTGLHVHTAGSVDVSVFKGIKENFGVFYPMQTFSKNKRVNFSEIPIFIEASTDADWQILRELASQLSDKVIDCDSKQRMALHLAAVFSCNFTNHLFHLASNILKENELDFKLMLPLIHETIEKLQFITPAEAQTGPAVRNDQTIINKHINALVDMPEAQNIYKLLSENILKIRDEKKKF
jgi:predicted short-subunit dehydrogenase-like oxidoreductase (DUF2520 family)